MTGLACMESLTAEIETAMAAIAANELATFEGSVVRQRALCEELAEWSESAEDSTTPGLLAATERLMLTKQRYSTLLETSGRTLKILGSLHGLNWNDTELQRNASRGRGTSWQG